MSSIACFKCEEIRVPAITDSMLDLLCAMPLVVSLVDRDGETLLINRTHHSGHARQEVIGRNVREFTGPSTLHLVEPILSATIDYRQCLSDIHGEVYDKKGNLFTQSINTVACKWEGKVVCLAIHQYVYRMSTIETLADENLKSLFALQKSLQEVHNNVNLIKTLIMK